MPFLHLFFIFLVFLSFRAAHEAYGGSQARGPIRTVAAGLHQSHSNAVSELHLQPPPQLMATRDPQPPGIKPTISWFLVGFINHCTTTGTLRAVIFFFFFLLFRDVSAAYGGSQARDPIGAVATGLRQSLNPLSEARDQTHNLMVPSWIC